MASVKVVTNNKKYKDGKIPIMLRAYSNGRIKHKVLFSILPKYWNGKRVKSTHEQSDILNMIINNALSDAKNYILTRQSKKQPASVEDILSAKPSEYLKDAFKFHIDNLKQTAKNNSARKYENVLDHCENFRPNAHLSDIDTYWIKSFAGYLSGLDTINSTGTVYRYIKFLKTVLKQEYNRGNFEDVRVFSFSVRMEQAPKTILTPEELSKFKLANVPQKLQLTKDTFLLQIYLRGIRVGDILQLRQSNIKNGFVQYIAQKTGKAYKVEIIEPMQEIIDKYYGQSIYVLPILTMLPKNPKKYTKYQKHIESKTAILNKNLKKIAEIAKINKRLTTHVARHTFASIADQHNLPLTTIQNLLGHSSPSQTDNYLKAIRKSSDLDDAVRGLF